MNNSEISNSTLRLKAIARWMKNHPFVIIIGIAGSTLAFVKGIPPAWEAIMEISGRPDCLFYGDVYYHSSGSLNRSGKIWTEYPEFDGLHNFQFEEVRRDREYIYIKNITPRESQHEVMLLRLPACGGAAQWSYQNPQYWIDLYQVWR